MTEEILKKINEALLTEEKAIPIYAKHIESTLFWSQFSEEHQKKMKDVLLKLKQETQKHRTQLAYLKKLAEERFN